jgi:hypothetical protein
MKQIRKKGDYFFQKKQVSLANIIKSQTNKLYLKEYT